MAGEWMLRNSNDCNLLCLVNRNPSKYLSTFYSQPSTWSPWHSSQCESFEEKCSWIELEHKKNDNRSKQSKSTPQANKQLMNHPTLLRNERVTCFFVSIMCVGN